MTFSPVWDFHQWPKKLIGCTAISDVQKRADGLIILKVKLLIKAERTKKGINQKPIVKKYLIDFSVKTNRDTLSGFFSQAQGSFFSDILKFVEAYCTDVKITVY